MLIVRTCLTCEKEFNPRLDQIKRGNGKYCSRKCQPPSNKGIPHSIEAKQKMSESHKGKTHSVETRRKMSESHVGCFEGSKHPQWKGGRIKDAVGYIRVFKPDHPFSSSKGYILEHRFIIEKQIGRYLTVKEVGHHRGKKDDNRPHMLMGFSSNAAHHRFHGDPCNVKPEEIIFNGK